MKNPILSRALESLETPVPDALPVAAPTPAPAPAANPDAPVISRENTEAIVEKRLEDMSKDRIVMNAPLSTIFTRALNISLAKKNVVTGNYDGTQPAAFTQGEAVSMESQAQDVYYSAAARRIAEDAMLEARPGDPTEPKKPEIPDSLDTNGNGVKLATPATQEETVKFFNSDSLDGLEPQFVFYQNVQPRTDGVLTRSWDDQKMIMLNDKGGEGYVVESVEIVVRTRKMDEEQIAMEGMIGDFIDGIKNIFGSKSKKLNLEAFSYWDDAKANKLMADIKKNYGDKQLVARTVRNPRTFTGSGIGVYLATGMSAPTAAEAMSSFKQAVSDVANYVGQMNAAILKYYGEIEVEVDKMLKTDPTPADWEAFNQKIGIIGFKTKFPPYPNKGLFDGSGNASEINKTIDDNDINQLGRLHWMTAPSKERMDRNKLDFKTLSADEVTEISEVMIETIKFLRKTYQDFSPVFEKIHNFVNKSGKIDRLAKISSRGKIFLVQNAWNEYNNGLVVLRTSSLHQILWTVVAFDRWIVNSLR